MHGSLQFCAFVGIGQKPAAKHQQHGKDNKDQRSFAANRFFQRQAGQRQNAARRQCYQVLNEADKPSAEHA